MDTEPQATESHEVLTMRAFLAAYLHDEERPDDELVDWLQGYDLPIGSSSEEPFVWLLRGLPLAGERKKARCQLGQRVARLLDAEPEIHRPGRRPDQLIHNLLMLAAGLGPLQELASALDRLLERSALSGEYRGLDLRASLRMALIENQIDARWAPHWFEMLENGGAPKLPGGPSHGFDGVHRLPLSLGEVEGSFTDHIGRALKAMAVHLDSDPKRRPHFRDLLARVGEARGGPRGHGYDLILQADRTAWPPWAVECLPDLFLAVPGKPGRFLAWHYLLASLPRHLDSPIYATLCDGHVLETSPSAASLDLLSKIAPRFEQARTSNPYPSTTSTQGAALTTIQILSEAFPELELNVATLRGSLLMISAAQNGEEHPETRFGQYLAILEPVYYNFRKTISDPKLQIGFPVWAQEVMLNAA